MNRLQIAFITGRSDPGTWQLSTPQRTFLDRLAHPGRWLVPLNFPYGESRDAVGPPGLWQASLSNAREYLVSRQPAFRQRYRGSVLGLLASAEHTVFLAGSCGLELLNNLDLPSACAGRLSVYAYGPVARARPRYRHRMVQGERDWISRLWFKEVDLRVDAGHLNYLGSPGVLADCRSFIDRIERGQA